MHGEKDFDIIQSLCLASKYLYNLVHEKLFNHSTIIDMRNKQMCVVMRNNKCCNSLNLGWNNNEKSNRKRRRLTWSNNDNEE